MNQKLDIMTQEFGIQKNSGEQRNASDFGFQRNTVNDYIDKLEADRKIAIQENEQLKQKLDHLTKVNEEYTKKLEDSRRDLVHENEELKQKLSKLIQVVSENVEKLEKEYHEKFETEKAPLIQENEKLNQKLEILSNTVKELNVDIKQLNEEKAFMEKERVAFGNIHQTFSSSKEQLLSTFEDLENQFNNLKI